MAQLRDDYDGFVVRQSEVVVTGPNGYDEFKNYWENNRIPFVGLPDPINMVLELYGQQVKLFKLGRMPAQVIIDRNGWVRFAHYSDHMGDIPDSADFFKILDGLNEKKRQSL